MKKDYEKEVLKFLKRGYKSTTEIGSYIGRAYYDTLNILGNLEEKGKIEKTKVGKYTLWRIKK